LPSLVALSEIGLQSGVLPPDNAAALVGTDVLYRNSPVCRDSSASSGW